MNISIHLGLSDQYRQLSSPIDFQVSLARMIKYFSTYGTRVKEAWQAFQPLPDIFVSFSSSCHVLSGHSLSLLHTAHPPKHSLLMEIYH